MSIYKRNYYLQFNMLFSSPHSFSKSSLKAFTAISTVGFFINPSITSGAIVAAPIPYLQSSNTCCEFLKLAARTLVFILLFL